MPLVLAGAPIGRPTDASARLRDELATADVIAAEDTRRLQRLCKELEVQPAGRGVSYFDGNEVRRTPQLLDALRAGSSVLLIPDARMPPVSAPGYRLAAAAAPEGPP